jgi:hypothetical protein
MYLGHHPSRDRPVATRESKANYPAPETVAAVGCVVFAVKESWA